MYTVNCMLERTLGNLRVVSCMIQGWLVYVITDLELEVIYNTSGDVCAFFDRECAINFMKRHILFQPQGVIRKSDFDDYPSSPGAIK